MEDAADEVKFKCDVAASQRMAVGLEEGRIFLSSYMGLFENGVYPQMLHIQFHLRGKMMNQ